MSNKPNKHRLPVGRWSSNQKHPFVDGRMIIPDVMPTYAIITIPNPLPYPSSLANVKDVWLDLGSLVLLETNQQATLPGDLPKHAPPYKKQSMVAPPGQRLAGEDRWCAGRKVAPAPLW